MLQCDSCGDKDTQMFVSSERKDKPHPKAQGRFREKETIDLKIERE